MGQHQKHQHHKQQQQRQQHQPQQQQHQKQQQQQQPHQIDGNGDYNEVVEHIINTSESHAIAMEKDNQYYEVVQKKEKEENDRLREELKNLEAINELARTKQ